MQLLNERATRYHTCSFLWLLENTPEINLLSVIGTNQMVITSKLKRLVKRKSILLKNTSCPWGVPWHHLTGRRTMDGIVVVESHRKSNFGRLLIECNTQSERDSSTYETEYIFIIQQPYADASGFTDQLSKL